MDAGGHPLQDAVPATQVPLACGIAQGGAAGEVQDLSQHVRALPPLARGAAAQTLWHLPASPDSSPQGSPAGEHPASTRLLAAPLFRLQPLSLLCLHPGGSTGHSPLPPAAAPHPPPAAALGPARPALAGQGGGAAGPGKWAVTPVVPAVPLYQQHQHWLTAWAPRAWTLS